MSVEKPFTAGLERNAANDVRLSPFSVLVRSAFVSPKRIAAISSRQRVPARSS
jgi:hypothetical protein